MNIEHLKMFVRLASTHNISLAGSALGLSPAVASTYISKLEQSLNVRLVHRTTRQVSLTQEGLAFLPHAREVLESVESARASVGAGKVVPQGVLRISAPASFGRMHLIPLMKEFTQHYPQLTLDFRLSDSIIDLVEGGFDVAIRNAALKDSTLVARKLASDTRRLCASPSYIEQFGLPQHPNDLLEHRFLHLSGTETCLFETAKGELVIKPKGHFIADNGEAVRDACIAGLGISICSTWCCYQYLKSGELVDILTDFPLKTDSAIWAVYPSSKMLAPKVRAFIDFFTERFGPEPYWDRLNNEAV